MALPCPEVAEGSAAAVLGFNRFITHRDVYASHLFLKSYVGLGSTYVGLVSAKLKCEEGTISESVRAVI